MMMMMIIIF